MKRFSEFLNNQKEEERKLFKIINQDELLGINQFIKIYTDALENEPEKVKKNLKKIIQYIKKYDEPELFKKVINNSSKEIKQKINELIEQG